MVDSWMDGVAEAYKIFQIFICWHWYAISVLLLPGNCHPKMTWDDHCPSSWSSPPPRRWQPMSVTVLKPKHKLWPCLSWHDRFLYLWLFYSGGFLQKKNWQKYFMRYLIISIVHKLVTKNYVVELWCKIVLQQQTNK